jgi:hypothetical protein
MKFLKAVVLPNTAGVSRAHWAPDSAQFARFNQFKGGCMFPLTQLFFQFRRSIGRNAYFEVDEKEHRELLTVNRSLVGAGVLINADEVSPAIARL